MIAFIEGKPEVKNPAYVIINCNGVGYLIHISLNTFSKLPQGEKIRLHTYHAVSENAQTLFGFAEEQEKDLFKHLISVSGIGPNTARMILSSASPQEIKKAIVGKDLSLLQTIKGIGAKSAQRIVVDLKDKLEKEGIAAEGNLTLADNTLRDEALSALVMLGFNKVTAQKTIHQLLQKNSDPGITVEKLIKDALKSL